MNLKMEDVIRAISEEKAAWDHMVNSIPSEDVSHRTVNENRRNTVNVALLNVLHRLIDNLEEA